MVLDPLVRDVFAGFQNLNLAALIDDLRLGHTMRGGWSSLGDDRSLCPVSHGMADGDMVTALRWASQAVDVQTACRHAARHLRTDPICIYRFVCLWDSSGGTSSWLLGQLEALWRDRVADAEAVQEILEGPGLDEEAGEAGTDQGAPWLEQPGVTAQKNGGSVWESNPPRA